MKLSTTIEQYIAAAFAGIYVQTHEPDDAVAQIQSLCKKHDWTCATWDVANGLQVGQSPTKDESPDPIAAIQSLKGLRSNNANSASILILRNFHRFLDNVDVMQATESAIAEGKKYRTFVLVLAPEVKIPIELQKQFAVVEHSLPCRAEMESVLKSIATEKGDVPEGTRDLILDAAGGLTRAEAEGAFSLSLVQHSRIVPKTVWDLKASSLKKSGLLELYEGEDKFDDLGGLNNLKKFCKSVLTNKKQTKAKAKGVTLLGVPGTGKSAFCKALGNETDRPTINLNIGRLMGGIVGDTERNTREALAIVDAMSPCVLLCDEVEKAFGGTQSGQSDGGVGSRIMGTWLTWLSDHKSNVFVVATSNNISLLPPEFTRAGRFNGVFFLDLPSPDQRKRIWEIHMKAYGIDSQTRPNDKDWTGAEIQSCCEAADLLGVSLMEAASYVVPIAQTASREIEGLREWASGRCLSSEVKGLYHKDSGLTSPTSEIEAPQGARNIKRRPSTN
jgi:hypothetical protein